MLHSYPAAAIFRPEKKGTALCQPHVFVDSVISNSLCNIEYDKSHNSSVFFCSAFCELFCELRFKF
jgi:hypothetical protein